MISPNWRDPALLGNTTVWAGPAQNQAQQLGLRHPRQSCDPHCLLSSGRPWTVERRDPGRQTLCQRQTSKEGKTFSARRCRPDGHLGPRFGGSVNHPEIWRSLRRRSWNLLPRAGLRTTMYEGVAISWTDPHRPESVVRLATRQRRLPSVVPASWRQCFHPVVEVERLPPPG